MTGRPEAPSATWWTDLWQPFWVLPSTLAGCSLLLGILLPVIDTEIGQPWFIFQGGVEGARSVLTTIAGAMISVTGLVFSITIVILQLASSQFSPRVLGNFLQSRVTQVTLGVFAGSFLYSLTVLRAVRAGDTVEVPQTAVTTAYLYVVVAVAMFLAFIHHITSSVQVSMVMTQIRHRTLPSIERLHAETSRASWSAGSGSPRMELTMDDRCGYVVALDSTVLVRRARDLDVVIEVDTQLGDFLAPGQPYGRVWGRTDVPADEVAGLVKALHVADERQYHNDVGFGVRQLLDIAERALSPAVNDPTTAVQALDELHVLLRRLALLPDPTPYLVDDDDQVRVVYRPQSYVQLLELTVEELVHYGSDSARILAHLRRVLEDLAGASLRDHRTATEKWLDRLDPG